MGRGIETVSFDHMISTLAGGLDFYVDGAYIMVNGEAAVTLANVGQAEDLLYSIGRMFYRNPEGVPRFEFLEQVLIVPAQVHSSQVMNMDLARSTLTTHRTLQEVYIVRLGDSLYAIARRFGMTLNSLLMANPNIDPYANLREGTPLVVTVNIPIISVRTFERITFDEFVEPNMEHRHNPSMGAGQQRVYQEGSAGIVRVTADIVSVNGVEISRDVIFSEIILAAIPRIIEIGSR